MIIECNDAFIWSNKYAIFKSWYTPLCYNQKIGCRAQLIIQKTFIEASISHFFYFSINTTAGILSWCNLLVNYSNIISLVSIFVVDKCHDKYCLCTLFSFIVWLTCNTSLPFFCGFSWIITTSSTNKTYEIILRVFSSQFV